MEGIVLADRLEDVSTEMALAAGGTERSGSVVDWSIDKGGKKVGRGVLVGGAEHAAALGQFLGPDGVGQEAGVSNADESLGEDVEQEAPDELRGGEGHDPGSVVVGIVLPAETDVAIVE